jgi:Zn-dependent metalloprotease
MKGYFNNRRLLKLGFISCFAAFTIFSSQLFAQNTPVHQNVEQSTFDGIQKNEGLEWFKKSQQDNRNLSWTLISSKDDKLGFNHQKFSQTFNKIPFEQSELIFHYNKEGNLYLVNGNFYQKPTLENKVKITKDEAFDIAIRKYNSEQFAWECEDDSKIEEAKLVIYPKNDRLYYAYKIDLYSVKPLSHHFVYIDAGDGAELGRLNLIMHSDVTGSGTTMYRGTKNFTTDSLGVNNYRLRASSGGGIHTVDMNTGTSGYVDFTDSDNNWTTSTNQDLAANDVHWGVLQTYNYFYNEHSRSSYDDDNALIRSRVHYDSDYNNAFWDGTQLTFGDGDGTYLNPLVSIDVVGHEFTHGVVQHSAGLIYSYESGALNESFADIFGVCIDFYADSANANYKIGEEFFVNQTNSPALRSMADPNLYGDPDTYQGTNWATGSADNGGVHTNSGVQNYWFYLLTMGGSGMNDNSDSYNITGIGIDKAAEIAYRNLTVYLNSSSNYNAARNGAIQSAIDLFGNCSAEVIATTNAWHAVGVGNQFANSVSANFSADITYSCSSPVTVQFTNQSTNGTSYVWNFGDGTTSTLAAPSHTYSSAGVYTVSLITNGSAVCSSSPDTLVLPNYITVDNSTPLASVGCNSSYISNYYSNNITSFRIDSLEDNQLVTGSYIVDRTCDFNEYLTIGHQYDVNVESNDAYSYKYVYIDFDNSGAFETDELIYSTNQSSDQQSIILNSSDAVYNTPVRMRVLSQNSNYTIINGCASGNNGQQKDYRVTILNNTSPPVADFTVANQIISTGSNITFVNQSLNLPTSYTWSFPGASVTTSSAVSPTISYPNAGTYDVQLIATNSFGSDTLLMPNYITVNNTFVLCTNDSTTATTGTLYDNGGPTGNYPNGSFCEFLINPGCATSITMNFTQFQMENCCDYLRIYDGVDNSGTLLLSANGTSIPSSVTAASGSMYIRFTSDGSVTGSGFEANWTSVIPTTPPIADFTISDTIPAFNAPVSFTNSSTGLVQSSMWDFGDGTTSTDMNPIHSYSSSGLKTVQLIVDNCFALDTISYTLNVQLEPVMDINPDTIFGSVYCSDSTTSSFTIENNGGGDLLVNIDGLFSSNGSVNIAAFTYGTDYFGEFTAVKNIYNNHFPSNPWTEISATSPVALQTALADVDILIIPELESAATFIISNLSTTFQTFINQGGKVLLLGNPNSVVNAVGMNSIQSSSTSSGSGSVVNSHDIIGSITNYPFSSAVYRHKFVLNDYLPIVNSTSTSYPHAIGIKDLGDGEIVYIGNDYFNVTTEAEDVFVNSVNYLATSISEWLSVQEVDTILSVGDSLIVDVDLNASNLFAGNYMDSIMIESNDSNNTTSWVYVSLEVLGDDVISVVNSLTLDTIQQGNSSMAPLVIENIGCDTLMIDSMILGSGEFTITPSGSFVLDPYTSDTLEIQFTTSGVGMFTDTLTIYNSDSIKLVALQGYSIGAPIISFNPTEIIDTVFGCNDSVVVPVTVYNTGLGDLESTLDIFENGNVGSGPASFVENFENWNTNNWVLPSNFSNYYSLNTTDAVQGSTCLELKSNNSSISSYGINNYFPQDTNTSYSFWMKSPISNTSSHSIYISFRNANNQESFAFAKINSNQYRVYGKPSYTNFTVPNPGEWNLFEVRNIDYQTKKGDIYVNDSLIVANYSFWHTNFNTDGITRIYVGKSSSPSSSYMDDIRIGGGLISDWAYADTDSLFVGAGDSNTFNVTLNATNLSNGTYLADLVFETNILQNPFDSIPISFTVIGESEGVVEETCLNFPVTMQGLTVTDSFYIKNVGCDTLDISSMTNMLSVYTSSVSNMNIAPNDSALVSVDFVPSGIGNFSDTLMIYTNTDTHAICLTGQGLGAPDISINPTSVTETVSGCVDSVELGFWIFNTGDDTLNYSEGSYVFEDFENFPGTTFWSTYNGVQAGSLCEIHQGSSSLYFKGSSYNRYIMSDYYTPTSSSDSISLFYKAASGWGSCENPDYNEHLIVQYSTNGFTWSNLGLLNNFNTSQFHYYASAFPASVIGTPVKIRIKQNDMSGANIDTWIVDNISLSNNTNFNSQLAAGDSVYYTKMIYVGDLPNGSTTKTINISSNDPDSPVVTFTADLNINNTPCLESISDSLLTTCGGEVAFSYESLNTPTTFAWSFGDGNSSVQANPNHVYSSGGLYNVQLIACNTYGCDTVNTNVSVGTIFGPQSACEPSAYYSTTNYDISYVELGNISNYSGSTAEGYSDYTCTDSTTLYIGDVYNLVVNSLYPSYTKYVKVWIDYNNNGMFEASETVSSMNSVSPHQDSFTIPATAVVNTPLRMRVKLDYNYSISTPCNNVYYGETEDYTVFVKEKVLLPVANFTKSEISKCEGIFDFTDNSTNSPTSWSWNFGDGNMSNQQNPTHQYSSPGLKTVQLIATNTYGSDTTNQSVLVKIAEADIDIISNIGIFSPIQFTNTTSGISSYQWNFGDGTTSTLANPSHTYTAGQVYTITLEVTNSHGCKATDIDTLDLTPFIGLEEVSNSVEIYPNPVSDIVTIDTKGSKTISNVEIYSVQGKLLLKTEDLAKDNSMIDVSHFAQGVYTFRVNFNDSSTEEYRVMKK